MNGEALAEGSFEITPFQFRATVKIFAEHSFLKSENALLNDRISLLERSGKAKDFIIESQTQQFNTLNEIIVRKDAMLANSDAAIERLKAQVVAE